MSTGWGMCGGSFPVPRPEVLAREFLPPSPSPGGIFVPIPIPTDPH
ncbi:hypothetical protein A2U01_0065757, partial [Trifolium medium]|nr:hypothetical protein [Trifolium medium]